MDFGYKATLFFVPLLFALCFHEFAHGWVARRLGDRTAELMGRLTMNPTSHMDMLGTVILPLTAILFSWPVFGWAKPVPVNARNLKNPRQDMFWIALAGPMSNVLLAVVAWGLLAFIWIFLGAWELQAPVTELMIFFLSINLLLALFNLIPLHPLDGGKILARFLPEEWNRKLEENQMMMQVALMMLIFTGGFRYIWMPVQWLSTQMVTSAHLASSLF